jgi:hypothetical protein
MVCVGNTERPRYLVPGATLVLLIFSVGSTRYTKFLGLKIELLVQYKWNLEFFS